VLNQAKTTLCTSIYRWERPNCPNRFWYCHSVVAVNQPIKICFLFIRAHTKLTKSSLAPKIRL